MNPELIARELEKINNRDMSRKTAEMFMIELNKQLTLYPQLKTDPLIQKQIERFETDLAGIEADWAQKKLAELVSFKQARGMLAGEVDENYAVAWKKEILNETDIPRTGSKSLETLTPTPDSFFVLEFAESTLVTEGFEYTVWGVKKYQVAHNIGVDGVIGRDTYLEMTAGTVLTQAQKNIETVGISEKTLWAIKSILETANKKGVNIILIRSLLKDFEANHSNDANFNTRYKAFFDWYNTWETWYNTSAEWRSDQASLEASLGAATLPNGQKESPEQKTKRESLYRRVMSWEYGIEDLAKDAGNFATHPFVILILGWLFLFGKIGAGTKATDSWWKRLLIVGTMAYHKDSVKDIISDVTGTAKEWWNKEDDETPQEALKRNINDPESSLSKAFNGDTTLQTASIEEFQTEEVLKNIKLVDIPGYITAINEKKDIPTFLSHIEVDGKILTLEQVRIILEGIYETSKGMNLTYIHEVFSAELDADINAVSMIAWGVWTVLLGYFSLPILASVAALVWVLWATGNMDTVIHDLGPWIQSFLSSEKWKENIALLESTLSQIQNPDLKMRLGTASKEVDLGIKLQMIQDLKSEFPNEAQEIQKVIDSLIQIEVTALESLVDESIETMTPEQLQTTQNEATKLLTTIQSYDTWNIVVWILNTLIQKIQAQIPLATQKEMNQLRETQNSNELKISKLRKEIEDLNTQILIAKATDLNFLNEKLSIKKQELESLIQENYAITWKIPALEVEIANQEVHARISQIQAQKEFLDGPIAEAQKLQGALTVQSVNQETFTAMQKILDESRSAAEKSTSTEKETLLILIAEVETKIVGIRQNAEKESKELIIERDALIQAFIATAATDIGKLKDQASKIQDFNELHQAKWLAVSTQVFDAELLKKEEAILDTPFATYQPIVEILKWYTIPSSIEATKKTQLETALKDQNLSVRFLLEILRNPDFQASGVVLSIENYILIK